MTEELSADPSEAPPAGDASRWAALRARDADADGRFVYAVKTTGVYCRPSCGARPPRPENVVFYASGSEAERHGFRACKRCRPDQVAAREQQAGRVAELCRWLSRSERLPPLGELAARLGLGKGQAQRVFKSVTGTTPRAYWAARRAERVRTELRADASVTAAIYGAGFQSSGRFYSKSNEILGMTPSQYRAGGKDVHIRFAVAECDLGSVLVAATPRGVCAISLGDDPEALVHDLERRFPSAQLGPGGAEFDAHVAQVIALVQEPRLGTRLPLDVRGTAFQQRVWQALTRIPPGKALTYTELAQAIGAPRAVRAVASACAANTLAVAIPCHRVVRSDGSLSGYRWGVERKRELLARERVQAARGKSAARE